MMGGRVLTGRWVLAVLALTLGVQIVIREGRPAPPLPGGPYAGDLLPELPVGMLDGGHRSTLREVVSGSGTCSLLAVISTSCGVCARMRVTWLDRFNAWADSVDGVVRPVWLAGEGEASLERFTRDFDLASIDLVFTAGSPRQAGRELGVIGTPTLYLVDAQGRVRSGVLGDQFPPADIARSICE
ncbi:MAG: hypothetical protein RQ745_12235 [Longimicrobiales bacterium]|nr:hypothetical protein [Longimicrobiales bacterium]